MSETQKSLKVLGISILALLGVIFNIAIMSGVVKLCLWLIGYTVSFWPIFGVIYLLMMIKNFTVGVPNNE